MTWDGGLFIDTTLPFGLRSAPKIFSAVADAVEWVARHEGVRFVIHYLDDFLVFGTPNTSECPAALAKLLDLFHRLGLQVAVEKREGPATQLEFEIDSVKMIIRLSDKKLAELKELLHRWQGRKAAPRRELESLIGKLAHASRVIAPGRTFMRRMFELLKGIRKPHYKIRLCRSFRSDLQWWTTLIDAWNGVGLIRAPDETNPIVHIWTDASGHFGCGALDPGTKGWLQLQWPPKRLARTQVGEHHLERTCPSGAGMCSMGDGVAEEDSNSPLRQSGGGSTS